MLQYNCSMTYYRSFRHPPEAPFFVIGLRISILHINRKHSTCPSYLLTLIRVIQEKNSSSTGSLFPVDDMYYIVVELYWKTSMTLRTGSMHMQSIHCLHDGFLIGFGSSFRRFWWFCSDRVMKFSAGPASFQQTSDPCRWAS